MARLRDSRYRPIVERFVIFMSKTQTCSLSLSAILISWLYQSRSFLRDRGRKLYGLTNSGKGSRKMYLSVKQTGFNPETLLITHTHKHTPTHTLADTDKTNCFGQFEGRLV